MEDIDSTEGPAEAMYRFTFLRLGVVVAPTYLCGGGPGGYAPGRCRRRRWRPRSSC